ncbi:MAG: helix-turn-helix transcriptional regulator [Phycisphaerales bacterium]
MAKLLDRIREAVESSGQTRYAIAKATGIAQSQLSRLVRGENGLTIETAERLADHLGLRIALEPKSASKRKTKGR